MGNNNTYNWQPVHAWSRREELLCTTSKCSWTMDARVETAQVMHVDSLSIIIADSRSWCRPKQACKGSSCVLRIHQSTLLSRQLGIIRVTLPPNFAWHRHYLRYTDCPPTAPAIPLVITIQVGKMQVVPRTFVPHFTCCHTRILQARILPITSAAWWVLYPVTGQLADTPARGLRFNIPIISFLKPASLRLINIRHR